MEPITFVASIAPLQSGITIDGAENGMRVKLDIPEIELHNALALLAMRQQALRVTIDVLEERKHGEK